MADSNNRYDGIVIGSGLGGLTAGALAAKAGARVLLLERHYLFGGAATVFKRKKMQIEVGLHELDGLDEGDVKYPLFQRLGLFEQLTFVPVPEFYTLRHPQLGDAPFVMPEGVERAQAAVTTRFPQHAEGIKQWFATLIAIRTKLRTLSDHSHDRGWMLRHLPTFPIQFREIVRFEKMTVGTFLQQLFGDDEAIKLLLCANLAYYSASPDLSLLYFAAAQGSYHAGGGHYIKGGSQQLSNLLVKQIEQAGGRALSRRTAVEILVEKGRAVGVRHLNHQGEDAQCDYAPVIMGNAAPNLLADMLPEKFAEPMRRKHAAQKLSPSLWSLYLGLDSSPNALGMEGYSNFIMPSWMERLDQLAENSDLLSAMPAEKMPYFVATNYDRLAHGLEGGGQSLVVLCGLDRLENWQGLEEEAYRSKKAAWQQAIIEALLKQFPKLADHIVYQEMATARTVAHYLNTPGGAVYGYSQALTSAGRKRSKAQTDLPGLYLASAFASPGGGFTGAMLAGQNAYRSAARQIGWPIKWD
uniref:Putative FAD dependent oxidoreductase n=1 Tax=Magnetococcus massalia (strain MO-1) TaxID=451514 RepID=A0A1S7LJL3_MAGMO|nr:putative FAD dependent oxidoreductase [Candidatus Magnetococcus massalia]